MLPTLCYSGVVNLKSIPKIYTFLFLPKYLQDSEVGLCYFIHCHNAL